jgi:hypothetical protein
MRVLVTTASFGKPLSSFWINQKSDKYEIVINRIDESIETNRSKSMLPRLRAKIPKMLSWENNNNYDYYIWIDSSFSLFNELSIERLVDYCIGSDICLFQHSSRNSVRQELDFVTTCMKDGNEYLISRYEGERMTEQVENYLKDSSWVDNVLFECGTFIYSKSIITNTNHNLMKEWFYQNCLYSVQDQLSLPYLIHKFNVNYKLFMGNVYSNEYTK